MTKIQQLELALEKGFKYDYNSGIITTPTGVETSRTTLSGYIHLSIFKDNKRYSFLGHQFAWFYTYGNLPKCIDHINRIKIDNRITNLRSVTKSENAMNMNNVKGYFYCKRSKKYIARIMVNYKAKQLGTFENKEDAKNCYLENKNKYHNIN